MSAPDRPFRLDGAIVLVTGADGFVGGHLQRVLVDRGASVVGLGNEPPRHSSLCRDWVLADIADPGAMARAVDAVGPQAMVHLAGQASAGLSFAAPEQTFRANVAGTLHVLEALRRHAPAARILVVGSGEAYGPQPEGSRVTEEQPFAPVSPYAFSKAAADAMAGELGRAHGLHVVRTRSFSHAGPGQSLRFALPSFADQIAVLEREEREGTLRVGNLEVIRDILDVRDVVECYARLLEDGVAGKAYNVCSGVGLSLAAVVALLTRLARVAIRIEVDPSRFRPADVPYLVGDPAKVQKATGWKPVRDLASTVADLLEERRAALA